MTEAQGVEIIALLTSLDAAVAALVVVGEWLLRFGAAALLFTIVAALRGGR